MIRVNWARVRERCWDFNLAVAVLFITLAVNAIEYSQLLVIWFAFFAGMNGAQWFFDLPRAKAMLYSLHMQLVQATQLNAQLRDELERLSGIIDGIVGEKKPGTGPG